MTTLHLISSGKGNVGKSAFASVLACIATTEGNNPILVDADLKQRTLQMMHGDKVFPIVLSDDPDLDSQPDQIWYHIEKQTGDVIVDLGAQTDSILNAWLEDKDVIEMASHLMTPIYKWWVSDLDDNNRKEIVNLCQTQPGIEYVLVKNHGRAKPQFWEAYIEKNKDLKAVLEKGRLKQIAFPRLSSDLITKLRQRQLTFEEAVLDEGHKKIDRLNRGTVMKWIKKSKSEVDQIYQFKPAVKPAAKKKQPATAK